MTRKMETIDPEIDVDQSLSRVVPLSKQFKPPAEPLVPRKFAYLDDPNASEAVRGAEEVMCEDGIGRYLPHSDSSDGREVTYRAFIGVLGQADGKINNIIQTLEHLIPNRTEDELYQIIRFSKELKEKGWHIEALAVAELVRRFPANPGGRGKVVKIENSRDATIKSLAKQLGCGTSKIRQNINIIEKFGTYSVAPNPPPQSSPTTVTPPVGVFVKGANATLYAQQKTFPIGSQADTYLEILSSSVPGNKTEILTFQPHPLISKQF